MRLSRLFRVFRGGKASAPETKPVPTAPKLEPTINYEPADPIKERMRNLEEGALQSDFTSALRWLGSIWREYFSNEEKNSPLSGLLQRIHEIRHSAGALAGRYAQRVTTLEAEFSDRIRPEVKLMREEMRCNEEAKERGQKEIESHRRELKDLEFRLTGAPNISVPAINWFRMFAIAFFIFMVTVFFEVGLAARIVAYYSDLQTGQLASLGFSLVLTAAAAVWGFTERVLSSAVTTRDNYDRFKRKQRPTDEEARLRDLGCWQPERYLEHYFQNARTVYLVLGLGWFLTRLIMWMANRNSDNGVGLLVAALVTAFGFVGKWAVTFLTPPYGMEHNKLRLISQKVVEQEKELAKLSQKTVARPAALTAMAAQFMSALKRAYDEAATEPLANLRQLIVNAVSVGDKLQTLRQTITTEFVDEAASIAGRLATAQSVGNQPVKLSQAVMLEQLQLPGEPPELVQLREGWSPEGLFPIQAPTTPNRIIDNLLAELASQEPIRQEPRPVQVVVGR